MKFALPSRHLKHLLWHSREPNLKLYGSQVPVGASANILGDSRPKMLIPHLKGLRSTCIKRLNILRAEIVSSWGAGRTSMLRFYNNCLDYGCQVYSSAKPTAMRILDSAHRYSADYRSISLSASQRSRWNLHSLCGGLNQFSIIMWTITGQISMATS